MPIPAASLIDHGVSALNALLGDYLARSGNELAQAMAFYDRNRPVGVAGIPGPRRGRVCVLVHGLGCNESIWVWRHGRGTRDYGRALARRRGMTPAYVRYNTGLALAANGAALADLLDRLWQGWGRPIEEIVLIGHSMGGLVVRSATAQAAAAGLAWVGAVRHAVYLGSPHRGAPLERAADGLERVLGAFPTTATRVLADLLGVRSAGIRDLRDGAALERVGWLPTAAHYAITGTVHQDPGHPINDLLGDVLVTPESGSDGPGSPLPPERVRVMPGLTHLRLAYDPAVLAVIEGWLG